MLRAFSTRRKPPWATNGYSKLKLTSMLQALVGFSTLNSTEVLIRNKKEETSRLRRRQHHAIANTEWLEIEVVAKGLKRDSKNFE